MINITIIDKWKENMLKFTHTKNVTTSYQIKDIPIKVWKKFKMKCMDDNVETLQDGIINLIKQYNKGKVKLD